MRRLSLKECGWYTDAYMATSSAICKVKRIKGKTVGSMFNRWVELHFLIEQVVGERS